MNKGFSFIELMIVTLIITGVLAAIFTIAYQTQLSFDSEKQFTETSQHARVTMDQIVRYLRQAGNDPLEYMKSHNIPAVQVMGDNHVIINSDVTGSYDGTTGDPDGALDSPFEIVTVRYNPGFSQVTMDLNDGNGPQIMADHISAFRMRFFDSNGAATMVSSQVAAVEVEMTANTGRVDRRTGRVNAVSFRSEVFVRSKSFDLFDVPSH
jgi:prepilin-type N-terminal cleavage/methylation domain-containing protein